MQRENEISRVAVDGRRTDDDARCTLVAIQERHGGRWVFYPHGWAKFGVRLDSTNAKTLAQAILAEDAQ